MAKLAQLCQSTRRKSKLLQFHFITHDYIYYMQKIENYINGELIAPIDGNYLDNYNPSKGEVYSQIPNSQANDVENAVEAASKAFPAWSTMPKNERSKILVRLADLIEKNLEELAKA